MITGQQIRTARKLLAWSAARLARKSKRSLITIARFERTEGEVQAATSTLEAVRSALEDAGIEFFPANDEGPGVRLRKMEAEA